MTDIKQSHIADYLIEIATRNGDINAVNQIFPREPRDGALSDIAIGVKANIAVASKPFTGGISAYLENIPKSNSTVVERILDAGAPIIGSLNMEEGALGAQTDNPWFGKTHNPLKHGYTPGGSSGGSAAAVAANFVRVALGTDTMGSVRIPSAYCGIWGFKPSHDFEMLEGVMPLSPTLDTVGTHGHSLDDVVIVCEVICDRDFKGGKAGEVTLLNWDGQVDCEPDVQTAFEDFVTKLGKFSETKLEPYGFGKSRRAGLIISEVEGYDVHKEMLEKDPAGFSDFFRGMLEYGSKLPQEKVDAAYAHVKELRAAEFPDFILMPTAPQTAFKFGDTVPANQADFTAFANLTDRPAIAFPIGLGKNDMPVSAQLVGPRGGEADLVATVKEILKL